MIYKDISRLLYTAFPYISWPIGWNNLISFVKKYSQETKLTFLYWSKPPVKVVKLNSNGSAIKNTGKIGAGGIIRDHNGGLIYAYATPLGHGTNNQAEVKATI